MCSSDLYTLLLMVILTGCAAPAPGDGSREAGTGDNRRSSAFRLFPEENHTYLFYDKSHGFQVEFLRADGAAFLWYPKARQVIRGNWRFSPYDGWICFRFDREGYNPATGEADGDWICRSARILAGAVAGILPGDTYGLSAGGSPPWLLARCEAPAEFELLKPAIAFRDCKSEITAGSG